MSTAEPEPVILRGGCFCGASKYEVKGKPNFSIYCHCTICQRMTGFGSAFIHSVHYPASAFSFLPPEVSDSALITEENGENKTSHLDTYSWGNPPGKRYRCKKCGFAFVDICVENDDACIWGTHLDREKPGGKVIGWDVVKPSSHIFYDTAVVKVDDDLPKWEGFPGTSKRLG
ncbi:Mss4-like protein [Flagelloscypha sp. PMI_526]|nr:Mss4-like protein [Flagelloscypha sp. PMI_526]